ncbi:protein LAZ1 [Tanacetum coccineum]
MDCHVFGHTPAQCPKRVSETVIAAKEDVAMSSDGFTTIVNKKKKGKKQEATQSKHIEFHKPKSTFVYRPKHSQPAVNITCEDEPTNMVQLQNHFDALREQDDVLREVNLDDSQVGKHDEEDTSTSDVKNVDSDSEIEEMYVELNATKEASTCSEQVPNLSVCAVLESHVDLAVLSRNRDIVNVLVVAQSDQAMHVKITYKADNKSMGMPWLLLGDFNIALNMDDCFSGSSSMNYAICDFKDCVEDIEVLDVVSKLKRLKKPLRKLLTNQGNIHDRVNCLRHELDEVQKALDLNPMDTTLRDEEAVYVQAFNEAKLGEERFLKQKAKIEWLEVGDSNSYYFHKSIKNRNQRSRIDAILGSDNVVITGAGVTDVFVNHYQMFLGNNMVCDELNVEGLFTKKVSEVSINHMIRDVSNEEIKRAMFDIEDDRALGLDGYTSTIFKKGWNIVGVDICNAFRDFFFNGQTLKENNHTFIALVPKVITPLKVNDYRPIFCCNVIYKCISKIITNRIIDGIKEVVSDNQSAFVSGRRISDNILFTQELMHNYHRKRGSPRCAFKIDIEKAYDTIMAYVTSTSFSLGINGDVQGFFKGKSVASRGPVITISFYFGYGDDLFIFARGDVESAKVIVDSLEEFKLTCPEHLEEHDMLLGDVESAKVIVDSLEEFKLTSGLVPSIPKSTTCFCNVLTNVKLAILSIIPFFSSA